jgi:hypothetical protein
VEQSPFSEVNKHYSAKEFLYLYRIWRFITSFLIDQNWSYPEPNKACPYFDTCAIYIYLPNGLFPSDSITKTTHPFLITAIVYYQPFSPSATQTSQKLRLLLLEMWGRVLFTDI